MRRLVLLAAVALGISALPAPAEPSPSPRAPGGDSAERSPAARRRVVERAREHVGGRFRGDCSAFVRRVYAEAGVRLAPAPAPSASDGLYRALAPVRRPRPGDLAFFRPTTRRASGGRITHVALVEAVDGERVTLIHRGSRGIARVRMNLARRHDRRENDPLRRRGAGPARDVPVLSGELVAGYASALPAAEPRRAARTGGPASRHRPGISTAP